MGRLEKGTEKNSGSIALNFNSSLYINQGHDDSNIRKYQSQMLQSEMKLQDEKENLEILISNIFKDYQISQIANEF